VQFKGRLHLRFTMRFNLRFDLQFGVCFGKNRPEQRVILRYSSQHRHRIADRIAGRAVSPYVLLCNSTCDLICDSVPALAKTHLCNCLSCVIQANAGIESQIKFQEGPCPLAFHPCNSTYDLICHSVPALAKTDLSNALSCVSRANAGTESQNRIAR
jgi:hypothetical protein